MRWPNAFSAKPWPSSWTRIDTKLHAIQTRTNSKPRSRYSRPHSPEITRKTGSTRTGMRAIEKWGLADTPRAYGAARRTTVATRPSSDEARRVEAVAERVAEVRRAPRGRRAARSAASGRGCP